MTSSTNKTSRDLLPLPPPHLPATTSQNMASNNSELPRICVLGSLNIDLVSYVPHHPAPGETLTSNSFHVSPGGKVSCATFRANTPLIPFLPLLFPLNPFSPVPSEQTFLISLPLLN